MKALMSVGALVGAIALLLLVGMILDVVPSNTVRLVEGYMPIQMLLEVACFVVGFAGLSYMLNSMGMAVPRFWQGIGFWAFVLLYLKFRVYPPIPFSVRAMYGTVSLVAVFMWVSANEDDWKKFKQPIMNVLDAQSGANKMLRYAYLVLIPVLVGFTSFNAMRPKSEEPVELRTVHPAPPASTKVHGKTYTL
ncbi:MAG: cytochrome c, partial [Nitrospirota bacterium]